MFKARLDKYWEEYWYITDTRAIQPKTNSHTDLTGSQQKLNSKRLAAYMPEIRYDYRGPR